MTTKMMEKRTIATTIGTMMAATLTGGPVARNKTVTTVAILKWNISVIKCDFHICSIVAVFKRDIFVITSICQGETSVKLHLSQDCLVTVIHAFVTSPMDYCNSLMYGLPQCQISKLQRVQNAAARIVFDLSKFCHITPALRQLHWLPVVKRIQFKILLLTFKAIYGLSPPYISELITVKPKSTHGLRSNNSTLLLPPTQKMLPTLGARSFAAAAPALWNKLPADIRNVASLNSFKKSIKTFLFNESF